MSRELFEHLQALVNDKENALVDFRYTETEDVHSYEKFSKWILQGKNEPLHYLAGERGEKREKISSVFPTFQSAIVFAFSYLNTKRMLLDLENNKPQNKIASYAMAFEGNDYHNEITTRLTNFTQFMSNIETKVIVDTSPVLERDLLYKTGFGWFGKNSMLINRNHGSYFFIGSILFAEKLDENFFKESTLVETDHCGNCTACISLCPTDAIDAENRTIVASKCISTFTIETFKDGDPPLGYSTVPEIFGCDICQEVCPWNKKIVTPLKETIKGEYRRNPPKLNLIMDFFLKRDSLTIIENLKNMSNRQYKKIFKGTSLERTGRVGMLKNLMRKMKNQS